MKKITILLLIMTFLSNGVSAYAATPDNGWIYEGEDCIIKNFDSRWSFKEDMSVEPEYASSGISWISGNNSGNGTGAVRFDTQKYAFESPSYNFSLVNGRTYRISMDVKPMVDFVTDRFSFWISSQKADGSGEYLSIKTYIDGVDFKTNEWTNVSCYLKWDGRIDGVDVQSDKVNMKFQIGSAGVVDFTQATGDNNIPISYCFDNFEIYPFVPDFKAKVMGDYTAGQTILLKCTYDFINDGVYSNFEGFTNALINVKVNDELVKEVEAKETAIELTDEYIGKKVTFEISPIVYGKQLEPFEIIGETVTQKENSYRIDFDSKLITSEMKSISGKVKKNIYNEENPTVYIASYENGNLKNVITATEQEFAVDVEGVDKVGGFVWNNDMTPLTEKTAIKNEENSISIFVDSQKGNDENTGDFNSPFKTVKRAKEAVKKIIKEHSDETNIRWNYDDTVLIVSGNGEMPDYKPGKTPWEKHRKDIRTLVIEEGITKIGQNAFNGFYNIKNAIIPDTVTSINTSAFEGCSRLVAVVVPDSVKSIETGAFDAETSVCVSANSVFADTNGYKKYTAGVMGDKLINIDGRTDINWAVYGGDTLVISGHGEMRNTYSDASDMPWKKYNSVLKKAVVDYGIVWITQGLLTSDGGNSYPLMETVVIADGVTQMRNNEVAGCKNLKRYDISNKLTAVEHWVMDACPIKELYLPATLTQAKDGNLDFNNLHELEALVLEEGFNMITTDNADEWGSFIRNAGKLKTVTFPESVTKVGAYSFSRMSALEKIKFLNPETVISENAFFECPVNMTVCGYKGSTAEEFALKKGYAFEEISLTGENDSIIPDDTVQENGINKIYVMLKSGEHFIDETLNFDYTDCDEEISVEYTTYGNEKAILSGGIKLDNTKWEVDNSEKGIYKNYVGKEVKSRQFFVDGVRANRARSNGGFLNYEVDAVGYLCDNTELLEYKYPEDLEILIHVAWTTPRCTVESVYAENGKVRVKMKPTAWNILWGRSQDSFEQCRPNNPYYYENAYELLDEEGEWYLNSHDGYLYYKPRAFEDMSKAEAVLPVTEKLIHIEGTKALEAQNIAFDNIEFAYSTWLRPSTDAGHCSNQNNTIWDGDINDMDKIYYPNGAIEVKCADNIDFTDCTFTKLGTIALKMHGGIHDSDVVGNEFYDLSAAALVISDRYGEAQTTQDDRYVNRDITISNNLMHSIGNDFHDSAALTTGYVMNTEISNNEIFNTPYSAMHLGFVENTNYISGLLIQNNYVHDYMKKMTDGGGIYLFSSTAGNEENPNIIRRNYVSHGWHGVTAYCIDYDVSNITFESNVNDSFNNIKNIDSYAEEWSKGWIPRDFNIGETNSSLKFVNNYGTNGYSVSDSATNCKVENHTVSEFGVWNNEAKSIIKNAGVKEEYLCDMQQFPREIEIAQVIELTVGDEKKIPFYAHDVNENIYPSSEIGCYCYSLDDSVVSVKDNDVLIAKKSGTARIKVVFRCNTVLRERIVEVSVK